MESIVDLELLDHRRGPNDDRWWTPPFDWKAVYEHPHWWNRQLGDDHGSCRCWRAVRKSPGAEVTRIEFDDPGGINPIYANVPPLGGERLEIQLIEVAATARGRRLGTQVVRALAERYPNRRLFAYSEGADRFWASIAWEPFYDPRPGPVGRTLSSSHCDRRLFDARYSSLGLRR